MAQVKYTDSLNGKYLDEAYGDLFYLQLKHGTTATFEDVGSGAKIVLTGDDMRIDTGGLIAGTVDKIAFSTAKGDSLATVTGHFDAADISDALTQKGALEATRVIFGGNDKFTGSNGYDRLWGFDGNDKINGGKGGDEIYGGAGKDVLIGGAGNDVFMFAQGGGKDVIKDFDATGGEHHQDLIFVPESDIFKFTIEADKHGDAMLLFDNGDTLTFEGVAKKQLTMDDFYAG